MPLEHHQSEISSSLSTFTPQEAAGSNEVSSQPPFFQINQALSPSYFKAVMQS